jgi:hypothetical protein
MPGFFSAPNVAAAAAMLLVAPPLAAQNAAPDFQTNDVAWVAMNQDLAPPPTGIGPTKSDPAHPYIPNGRGQQPTFRIADVGNPNLKPWAAAQMKKSNEDVLAGKIAFTARSSCMPAGVPGFSSFIVEPVYFIQSPKEVLMVYSGDQQLRRVYMNVPHSKTPKPSWYGESVGHYEGEWLVVDTIAQDTRTFIDNFRTPHSEKLHVVERYHLIDGGKTLEAEVTVEDPASFIQPVHIQMHWRKSQGPIIESRCADGESFNPFGQKEEPIPVASRPDF